MRDEELDRLIDAALNTYAEPRAGLENRVLAVLAAEREQEVTVQRTGLWRMWALGLCAVACVVIAVFVGWRLADRAHLGNEQAAKGSTPHLPAVHEPAAPVLPRAASKGIPESVPHPPRTKRARTARREPLPKQDVFPTPQPVSPEIAAFAQYLANAPQNERQGWAQAQARLDAPVAIPLLHIAPLDASSKPQD